jgi:hypothetical protein
MTVDYENFDDDYEGPDLPDWFECRACHCLVDFPEGTDALDEGLRYCLPCAITQIEQLREENMEHRAKIDMFAKCRDEAVKDGVFWKEKYEELMEARDE